MACKHPDQLHLAAVTVPLLLILGRLRQNRGQCSVMRCKGDIRCTSSMGRRTIVNLPDFGLHVTVQNVTVIELSAV